MFIIIKLLSRTIISPLFFIIMILGAGIKLYRINYKKYGSLLIIGALVLYTTSIRPIRDIMVRSLEPKFISDFYKVSSTEAYVLLGGGIVEGTPYGAIPKGAAYARIMETAILYNRDPKKIFVSGGKVFDNIDRPSESSVYKDYLISLGIPNSDIIIEERSRSTYENAKYTKLLLRKYNIHYVTLITSATHMRRSIEAFSNYKIQTLAAPSGFLSSSKGLNLRIIDLIPNFYDLQIFFRCLWEHIGIHYQRLKY